MISAFLKSFTRILFELKASEPPLKIAQFPDLRHKAETSAVTFGLLSYMTPITPIDVVTFLILKPFGLFHWCKTLFRGFLNFIISDSINNKPIFYNKFIIKDIYIHLDSESINNDTVNYQGYKFILPKEEKEYKIVGKYGYDEYPANPNGSDYNTAILSNNDGRHIAMMPHLERSTFPWNWPVYPKDRNDEVSPWIMAFENAKKWLEKNI